VQVQVRLPGAHGEDPHPQEILADAKLDPSEVAYIGDDFTDVVVMRRVGLAIATANARPEVKPIAHYVTQAPGGQGAVREVVELLLKGAGQVGRNSETLRS
jgi:3-deoxy-D-manno-octulosonate 8-phosphate phosphatase (KDO 8-P phosphatase)